MRARQHLLFEEQELTASVCPGCRLPSAPSTVRSGDSRNSEKRKSVERRTIFTVGRCAPTNSITDEAHALRVPTIHSLPRHDLFYRRRVLNLKHASHPPQDLALDLVIGNMDPPRQRAILGPNLSCDNSIPRPEDDPPIICSTSSGRRINPDHALLVLRFHSILHRQNRAQAADVQPAPSTRSWLTASGASGSQAARTLR